MSTRALGKLEKIEDLRAAWLDEPHDFTPWLALPENLRVLGDAVGIDLEFEAQEKDVGPFRADILCKNTLDGSWVLIENQLERTDHTHLGQLLTYAAGLETVAIIWIAKRFAEEHRATLDWLNEITDERFSFFGTEVELWRIGDSPMAPKFNVIARPNDWTQTVQTSARIAEGMTETKRLQLEFWTAFKKYMEEHSHLSCPKPLAQNWMNHAIGRTGFWLASVAPTYDSQAHVELVLGDQNSKQYFDILSGERAEIESEIAQPLTWQNRPEQKSAKLYVSRRIDIVNRSEWPQYFEWLRENLERFHRVFSPRVKQLSLTSVDSEFLP